MRRDASLFGSNFKYVLVLTVLAWMTYTLPSVKAAFETSYVYQPAASFENLIGAQSAAAAILAASSASGLPPQPANCPAGYACIPLSQIGSWCPPAYKCNPLPAVITVNGSVIDASTHAPLSVPVQVTVSGPINPSLNMTGSTFTAYKLIAGTYVFTANALGRTGSYTLTITDQDEQYPHNMGVQIPIQTGPQNPTPLSVIGVSIDPSSPTDATIKVSAAASTDVTALVFDMKTGNEPATLQAVNVFIKTGSMSASAITDVRLKIGGQSYAPLAIYRGSDQSGAYAKVSFAGLAVPLPAQVTVPATVVATIQADATGTLNGSKIVATIPVDAQNMYIESVRHTQLPMTITTLTGGTLTLSSATSALTIGNTSVKVTPITNSGLTVYLVSYTYTLTAGNTSEYISTNPASYRTSSTGGVNVVVSTVTPTGSIQPGDTSSAYMIAAGSSRSFVVSATARSASGTSGIASLDGISYGPGTQAFDQTLSANLKTSLLQFP